MGAADFGAPAWLFIPLLFWLATFGLPSTIAVLLTASVWGTAAPLYGFIPFLVIALLLAVGAQVLAVKMIQRFWGGSHEN